MVNGQPRVAAHTEPGGVCEPIGLLLTVRLNQLFPSWFGLGVYSGWACHLADDLARKVVEWCEVMSPVLLQIIKTTTEKTSKYRPDRMDRPDTYRVTQIGNYLPISVYIVSRIKKLSASRSISRSVDRLIKAKDN